MAVPTGALVESALVDATVGAGVVPPVEPEPPVDPPAPYTFLLLKRMATKFEDVAPPLTTNPNSSTLEAES